MALDDPNEGREGQITRLVELCRVFIYACNIYVKVYPAYATQLKAQGLHPTILEKLPQDFLRIFPNRGVAPVDRDRFIDALCELTDDEFMLLLKYLYAHYGQAPMPVFANLFGVRPDS